MTLYAYASVHVFDTFNDFVFYGHVLSLINPETVTRLRVTKSPETGGSLIAPYKRRGFSVRNAGIRRVDNPSPPRRVIPQKIRMESKGVERKLNRGFIMVWIRDFEGYCPLKEVSCNQCF